MAKVVAGGNIDDGGAVGGEGTMPDMNMWFERWWEAHRDADLIIEWRPSLRAWVIRVKNLQGRVRVKNDKS